MKMKKRGKEREREGKRGKEREREGKRRKEADVCGGLAAGHQRANKFLICQFYKYFDAETTEPNR